MDSELSNSEPLPLAEARSPVGFSHNAAPGATSTSAADSVAESLVTDQFQPLDPNNIQVEMISSLIFASVIAFAAVCAVVTAWFNVGFGWIFWSIAAGSLALVALLVMFGILWPRWEYRRTSYRVDDMGLEIRRGVIWRHQLSVPIGRVQHADVSQGPLQRLFGIATLTVHTAGTQNSSVPLEGLAHDLAMQLRDLIVHQRGEHDAV